MNSYVFRKNEYRNDNYRALCNYEKSEEMIICNKFYLFIQ